ncbi:MAG: azurin [Gammaproteobacteria bacterium]|nr:azurin [Gammaproteobacteria bacterium]
MRYMIFLVTAILSFQASATSECALSLSANDRMQFDTKQLVVSQQCESVSITLTHTGKLPVTAMGHNIVIALESDLKGIASDSSKAGLNNNYVQPGDERVIVSSKVIGGGGSVTISVPVDTLDPAKQYAFFCAVPGHWVMMKGEFKVTP